MKNTTSKTITVFTPTYNRAHTLSRVYESLKKQTVKDFEWLIIDDGSTDNTEELVESFKQKADFPIRYYWKENGGRHTAVNYSYSLLSSVYVVTCDSDDELVPDAIEKMILTWEKMPKDEYERFWCISGREMDLKSGKMVGKPYPDGINRLHGKAQRKVILKYPGEKHCCRKVAIHIKYPFPEYPDVKFVSENMVWEKINRDYDQYCVNDIYGYYHTDGEDRLSNGAYSASKAKAAYYLAQFYVNEMFTEIFFNRLVLRFLINISRLAMLSNVSYLELMKSLNRWYKRIIVTLGWPFSLIYMTIKGETK